MGSGVMPAIFSYIHIKSEIIFTNFGIYTCIVSASHIIAYKIAGLSRILSLKFPGLSRTKPIFQDFPGGMRTL